MGLSEIIRNLLENGVHFGHLSKHWNPKMKKFIFGKKKNVYIIDLEKTAEKLQEAKDFVKNVVADGGNVLFVGTKRQIKGTIEDFALSCEMPYVVERWIGGFLTNFQTIQKRIQKYVSLKEKKEKGTLEKFSNKETLRLNRDIAKMEKNYRGVVSLNKVPDCVYIIDPKKESAAVREAQKLSIPIVALVDTDSDPEEVNCPIPGNDDAIKSVRYITSCLVEAIQEGKSKQKIVKEKAKAEETVEPENKEENKNEEENEKENEKPQS